MLETVPGNPFYWICTIAAITGIVIHYLYNGWVEENYREIKWFRRLLLPHITLLLNRLDDNFDDVDMRKLYVETSVGESEHVLDIDVGEGEDYKFILDEVESDLKTRHFRPEVILSSLAENEDGYTEVGNWVLTAPGKDHPDTPFFGVLYDVFLLLASEWQLHVRIFYDEEDGVLKFYAHHEKNAYSPLHAEDHFNAVSMSHEKGRKLFLDEFPCDRYNGEVVYASDLE